MFLLGSAVSSSLTDFVVFLTLLTISEEAVGEEGEVQIQSPSTSSASKKKNPLAEMVGETQLVEAKGKPLVEPKGKHHRKNPLLSGLSLEKHQAIPSLDDVSILSLLHCQFLKFYSKLCSFAFAAHHEEIYSTWC
jgi:hypothetical protein